MDRRLLKLVCVILTGVLLSLVVPGVTSIAQGPDEAYSFGLLPSPAGDYPKLALAESVGPLPSAVDLSSGVPPVGNQGRQASCVGWAIAYYYRSFQEGVESHRAPSQPNELFSPAFIYNQRSTADRSRDNGMSMVNGLRIAVSQGVATLATMPYNAADFSTQPSGEARAEAQLYRAQSYFNIFNGRGSVNLQALKQHLATGDPLLLAVPVYSEFFRVTLAYPTIGLPEPGSTYYGGHAITVVGYDDETQAFKFVNSWGRGWGDHGYAYLTYDFVQQQAWEAWVLADADTTPPSLPDHASELGGTENDVAQAEISTPVFTWEASNDPTAVYQVYWGPAVNGTSGSSTVEAFFFPAPVTQTSRQYLRVRALDAAGNATPWRTLFIFRYVAAGGEDQSVTLQPLDTEPPQAS